MGAEHVIGLRLTADNKEAIEAIKAVRTEQDRLGVSARALGAEVERQSTAQGRMAGSYKGMDEAMRANSVTMFNASKDVQKLLDKYDPLGTKLRSLEADFHALDKAASQGLTGTRNDAAVDKTFAQLNSEISKTKALMKDAGVSTDANSISIKSLGLNTQEARHELMILGKEALYGDFSRMPRTFGTLVTSTNLLSAAMTPVGAAVLGVTAVVAAGVFAWSSWGNAAEEATKKAAKGLADAQKSAEKEQRLTPQERMKALDYRMQSVSFDVQYESSVAADTSKPHELRSIAARTASAKRDELVGLGRQKAELEDQLAKLEIRSSEKDVKDFLKRQQIAEKLSQQQAREFADAQARVAIIEVEAQAGIKLTEAQKKLIVLGKEQEQSVLRLTAVEYERQVMNLATVANAEINSQAITKELNDSSKLADQYTHEADALKKKNDAAGIKNEMMGKTAAEQAALQVAVIDTEIAQLAEAKAALSTAGAYDTQRAAIQKLIDAKSAERGIIQDLAVKQETNQALKLNNSNTQNMVSVGVGATTNAFFADNGKSFTENFTGSFKSALEPSINKLVVQLIVNAISSEKQSIATGDWVMAIIAIVSTQFGNQSRSMGTTTNVRGTLDGATSGNQSKAMQMDQTWFEGQKNWNIITQASRATLNAYSADIRSSAEAMYAAGDVLGVAGTRAKALTIDVSTAGNVTDALARNIGGQLVPGLVLFQREGENLAATAKRITDEFKATNDLINAVGVSSSQAFGGFGLQSAAAREDLIAAAGGLQAFSSSSKSYIQNFLTPAQQLQPALDDVAKTFNTLHISGISTNAEFAALVKAQMALGNTSVVGQLMTVADSFNTITKSAGDANNQLNALLNQDHFTTLVDYKRAMALNGAGSIASAQLSAAQKSAQDQAGTAAFTANNAAAIAAANQLVPIQTTTQQTTTGNGTFDEFLKKFNDFFGPIWISIKDSITGIWRSITDTIGPIWTSIKDGVTGMWKSITDTIGPVWSSIKDGINGIWNFAKDFVSGIVNGIKDGIHNITNVGGGGQIIPGFDNPFSGWSDPRLKENISPVGVTNHGLTQYDFSYKADKSHQMYRGVMADEVRRVRPDAVSTLGGFDRVDYAKLGIQMYKIPSFAVGTNYLPEDMLVQAHKAERIIPAADNRELMERLRSPVAANDAVVIELRALRVEMERLRQAADKAQAAADKTQVNTEGTHAVLKQFRDTGVLTKAAA